MKNTQEVSESLDEIIFEQRNKAYGAYALRSSYQKIIRQATLAGTTFFTLALLTPLLYAKWMPADAEQNLVITTMNLKTPEPPQKEEITPPEPPKVEPQPVATRRYVEPEIVPDDQATDEELVTQTELQDVKIGSENIDGVTPDEAVEVVVDETATKIVEVVEIEKDDVPFVTVEQQPDFPGGLRALAKFLSDNIKYPSPAQKMNIEGRVALTFIVSKTGEISNIEVLKGIGFGCDEEAIRVVRLMPRWHPGKQSGRAVPVKFTLPISFALQ